MPGDTTSKSPCLRPPLQLSGRFASEAPQDVRGSSSNSWARVRILVVRLRRLQTWLLWAGEFTSGEGESDPDCFSGKVNREDGMDPDMGSILGRFCSCSFLFSSNSSCDISDSICAL